jgi:signal transduction histidine kinase
LEYVLALSEVGLAEMRALILELRPETLKKGGLIEALSKQVTMLQARHGLHVRTHFDHEPDMPLHLKEAVYWIAREALYNRVKHFYATIVEINKFRSKDAFTFKIYDDGLGFETGGDFSGHLGLKSMSDRAQKIGGLLHIDSSADNGCQIEFQFPLESTS